jgi:hypothetical protein
MERKMSSAVIFMQWDSYESETGQPVFFRNDPLTFNSRQERLHNLGENDHLWLVSRCPADQQYYFVAMLTIIAKKRNAAGTPESDFGNFGLVVDCHRSQDFGKRFPAEGLLRALEFESGKPIKYGASIGHALQTLRILSVDDERILNKQLERWLAEGRAGLDSPFGLWTKCDRVFADYFLKNWQTRKKPLAFLLHDPPPALRAGSLIFIHSDKNLRLVANFAGAEFLAGHKFTSDKEERLAERERVWSTYRVDTLEPPTKAEFDAFWEKQHGIRALFVMDTIQPITEPLPFKVYGRALEWGYPQGVGYRYLSLPQTLLLLRASRLEPSTNDLFLRRLIS